MWNKEVLGALHKEHRARALPLRAVGGPHSCTDSWNTICGWKGLSYMMQETSTHCTQIPTP